MVRLIVRGTLLVLLVLAAKCSQTSPVAGGSGAGNPGSVTLAVRVDSTALLQKREATAGIGVKDDDSTTFTVNRCYLTVQQIRFLLDSTQDIDEIGKAVKAPLVYDSGSILLESAFTFNVLTGEVPPSLGTIALPAARYTGIKLTIAPGATGLPAAMSLDSLSIDLAGSFIYDSAFHAFSFQLSDRSMVFYHYVDTTFTIAAGDTTHLLLALDARQWLSRCRIGYCLDNGGLALDTSGNLTVYDSTGGGACGNLGNKIASNIKSSGSLRSQKRSF